MTDIDIETEEGAQQKADTAQSNAESHADAEIESHRSNETHDTAQPPESHDNEAHDRDFVDEGEAAAAAPVQSVNGQQGDVDVNVGGPITQQDSAETFEEADVEVELSNAGVVSDETISVTELVGVGTFEDESTGDWDWDGVSTDVTRFGNNSLFRDTSFQAGEVQGASLGELVSDVKFSLRSDGFTDGDTQTFNLNNESGEFMFFIQFTEDGDVVINHDGGEFSMDWDAFTWYDFTVRWDFDNNQADVEHNNGTEQVDFFNSASAFETLTANFNDSNSSSGTTFYLASPFEPERQTSATAFVEWPYPKSVFSWDVASFQALLDGETVEVFIEESTDGGGTWNEIQGPIVRGETINAPADARIRYRVEISRVDTENNPALDSVHRRWEV